MSVPDSVWELPVDFDFSPTEVLNYINEHWESANEDEKCTLFDLSAGLYWYCADYHSGQSSELYSIMSARLDYRPAPSERSPFDDEPGESEAARYVYEQIEAA